MSQESPETAPKAIKVNSDIALVSIADLIPDPRNPMGHPGENRDSVLESFRRFGQTNPVIVQRETSIVLAGNLRLEIAKELGMEKILASFVDFDDDLARAYSIADNRTAELSKWNFETLAEHVRHLQGVDPTLLIGWQEHQLSPLLNADFSPAPIEEMPAHPLASPPQEAGGDPGHEEPEEDAEDSLIALVGGDDPMDWKGRTSPALQRIADLGELKGRVLDLGCGTDMPPDAAQAEGCVFHRYDPGSETACDVAMLWGRYDVVILNHVLSAIPGAWLRVQVLGFALGLAARVIIADDGDVLDESILEAAAIHGREMAPLHREAGFWIMAG